MEKVDFLFFFVTVKTKVSKKAHIQKERKIAPQTKPVIKAKKNIVNRNWVLNTDANRAHANVEQVVRVLEKREEEATKADKIYDNHWIS